MFYGHAIFIGGHSQKGSRYLSFPLGLSLSRPVDTKTDFNLNNNIATLSLISTSSVKQFTGKCPDTYSNLGRFPFTKKPENFHWEFPFGKNAFHLSHVPFVHRPLSVASPNDQMPLVNCSAIISNTSFFVPFPPNKHLLLAYVVKRRLTSVSFHLPRCSGVETLPVNEELPKNFSELFMQHFRRKMCTGKNSFERARISTYHSYIRHICAAINFPDLVLELGRQSTHSSPESLLQKASKKLTLINRHIC